MQFACLRRCRLPVFNIISLSCLPLTLPVKMQHVFLLCLKNKTEKKYFYYFFLYFFCVNQVGASRLYRRRTSAARHRVTLWPFYSKCIRDMLRRDYISFFFKKNIQAPLFFLNKLNLFFKILQHC